MKNLVRLRVLVPSLCLASGAFAQTPPAPSGDLSRGATLPPTSAAFSDEATTLSVNPAGLNRVRAAQLFYLHDRASDPERVVNGLYLADTWFKALGVGLSHEWIRREGADYRLWTWGFSLGAPQLSLGAAFHNAVSSEDASLSALNSWDLGLQAKPTRFLALGLTARNLNQPVQGAYALERQYVAAVGIRPWREYVTLGVDWLVPEERGVDSSRLAYTVQARPWRGIGLSAGLSHGVADGDDDLRAQVALTADLPHLGVTYARGVTSNFDSNVVAVRLSAEPYHRGMSPAGTVGMLDLDDLLTPKANAALALLGINPEDPYLRLTVLLDQARRDPALSGLVIKIDGLPDVGLGKAEELRQAILRFRASGKKVVAYLLSATDTDYLVASAADQIYAAPESMLLLDGFAANVTFFGQAMEKLGVHWDVARVGAYKNAPDALTRSGMSDEQRESLNAYLDASVKLVESAVAQARQVSPERLREAWAEALIPPRRAQALKLVDDVLSPFELQERLKTVVPKARFTGDYRPPRLKETRWGIRPRVAVVPVIGNIAGGKSRQDPLGLAEVAGAETIVRALGRAAADPTVKAIVLRVDSPGGSGLASDLIYRAVLDAKKHKPVVASMGDYAASGGYYVAMGADEVLATSASLTGSIGVFLVKPAFEKLGEKLGIRFESVDRGPLAHILNINRPWNDAERTAAQRWVDSFYDGFITEVAASRKLDKAKVDAVAKGRIWAGEDALRRGLVDRTGGLFDALQAAQGRAQVSEADDPEWVVFGDAQGFLGSMGGEDGVAAKLLGSGKPVEAPPLAHLTRELGVDASFLLEPGMKARLPFGVQVR